LLIWVCGDWYYGLGVGGISVLKVFWLKLLSLYWVLILYRILVGIIWVVMFVIVNVFE